MPAYKKQTTLAIAEFKTLNVVEYIQKYAFNLLKSSKMKDKIISILKDYDYDTINPAIIDTLDSQNLIHYNWTLNKENNIEIWSTNYQEPGTMAPIVKNFTPRLLLTITKNTTGKSSKSTYKRTQRKHVNSKGVSHVIYTKNNNEYIRKKNKTTGKFNYRKI